MSTHVSVRYGAVAGTGAGLGRTASGRTLIADRPEGRAGGQGLGFNGAELLAAALGGCFWNDLHYVAEADSVPLRVDEVEAEVELAGNPPRIVRARIAARLAGNDDAVLARIFDAATEVSAIANSLQGALTITFDRLTGDER